MVTSAREVHLRPSRGVRRQVAEAAADRRGLAGVGTADSGGPRRGAAVLSGDPHRGMTVREVEIPDPGEYGPAAVKALRGRMGVSVAVFARLVGVTPAQVEHWEQGRRTPAPMARRLLDRIAADPAG